MVKMANLLKQIFSSTEPTIEGVLRFDSAKSKNEFLNTGLKKVEQGKSSTITGLEKLDIYSCTETGKHLFDSYTNILDPVIFPSDCFPFHLSTDFGDYNYVLRRENHDQTLIVRDADKVVSHVEITYKQGSDKVNFSWRCDFSNAPDTETLWKELNATYHLAKVFCRETVSEQDKNLLDRLYDEQSFWHRTWLLEDMLGAKFNVKSGTAADRMNTDLLYLLLVQKVPLRSNIGNFTVRIPYKSIESPIDENFAPGKEFAMRFDKERKGTLFGYSYAVTTHEYIFKANVDAVEKDDNEEVYILKCSGTDLEPVYKVEVYEDKNDQQFDMTEKFRDLQSAHSFGDEVKRFYGGKND